MTCWEDSQLFDVPDGVPPVPEVGPVEDEEPVRVVLPGQLPLFEEGAV